MEIHGKDCTVAITDSPAVRDFVARTIKANWPDCVLQQDGNDYFFHKNAESVKSWDEEGWSETNRDTMIYVIHGKKSLTLVVDENPSSQTAYIGKLIVLAL
jgi:hypothetical protein